MIVPHFGMNQCVGRLRGLENGNAAKRACQPKMQWNDAEMGRDEANEAMKDDLGPTLTI
jgi:hypothetical protein